MKIFPIHCQSGYIFLTPCDVGIGQHKKSGDEEKEGQAPHVYEPDLDPERELKMCTFKPQLNENTYKITSNRQDRDIFSALYTKPKVNEETKKEGNTCLYFFHWA